MRRLSRRVLAGPDSLPCRGGRSPHRSTGLYRPSEDVEGLIVIAPSNRGRRLAVAAGALAGVLLPATPALAAPTATGRLLAITPLETVGIYAGIPLAIVAVVSTLALLPSMLRSPRYRPGRGYDAPALWYGAPENPEQAAEQARPAQSTGGARGRW